MSQATTNLPNFTPADFPDRMSHADIEATRHTEAALERHKNEGMDLAVRARWVALLVIAIMLPFLNRNWDVIYYEVLLCGLALVGWAQQRYGRVGLSRVELLLLFLDLALATFIFLFPNPFAENQWPTAMVFRFENFIYFFVLLAAGTLTYSWRTIVAMGNWTVVLWMIGIAAIWWFGKTDPALSEAAQTAFGSDADMARILDPNSLNLERRAQEVVVFLIVAVTLALTVRRFNRLLLGNAELERERENLSRYFSPNVVEQLSRNDEPLKQTRTHNVAVLFVDIVGFTEYASKRPPEQVIETLRGFHALMETEVFRHGGTLDKYLGDGLMATFGTPMPGDRDAINALLCTRSMIDALDRWNDEREAAGEPRIRGSFGMHYGPVVLGDIGANRLEFAVLGNTVNVSSRLEGLTRSLDTRLVLSDQMRDHAAAQSGGDETAFSGLARQSPQIIRGLDQPMAVWTLT